MAEQDMHWAEDGCEVCGAHVGYGIRAFHLSRCDQHAAAQYDQGASHHDEELEVYIPSWEAEKLRKPQRKRIERRDIRALLSPNGDRRHELDPERRQFFCETGAAWELWDETKLLHRVVRWPKKQIAFVINS